jgi:hypothetical protein
MIRAADAFLRGLGRPRLSLIDPQRPLELAPPRWPLTGYQRSSMPTSRQILGRTGQLWRRSTPGNLREESNTHNHAERGMRPLDAHAAKLTINATRIRLSRKDSDVMSKAGQPYIQHKRSMNDLETMGRANRLKDLMLANF